MSRVFINYRRGSTSAYAGRIYDALAARLGEDRVFIDVDTLEPGTDFVEMIDQAIESTGVMLAVIGPDWAAVTDAEGAPRLADPSDFVRMELSAALEKGIRVLPVLVQGAQMPPTRMLPEDLQSLARRHAFEVGDSRWGQDVDELAGRIERALGDPPQESAAAPPTAATERLKPAPAPTPAPAAGAAAAASPSPQASQTSGQSPGPPSGPPAGAQTPPGPPGGSSSGPPTALIALLAVVAVAGIAIAVVALTTGGDDSGDGGVPVSNQGGGGGGNGGGGNGGGGGGGGSSEPAAEPSSGSSAPTGVPAGATDCGEGVFARDDTTSCAFARNVANDFFSSSGNTFESFSPTTGVSYQMTCVPGSPTVCTGGNQAEVYIP